MTHVRDSKVPNPIPQPSVANRTRDDDRQNPGIADNRMSTVVQRQLAATMDASPQQAQLYRLSQIANRPSGAAAIVQHMANRQQDIPPKVAQRAISIPKAQIRWDNPATASNALRGTYFSDIDEVQLLAILTELCRNNASYYNIPSMVSDVKFQLQEKKKHHEMPGLMAKVDDLPAFMLAQQQIQTKLSSMNGLQSSGFEFEFASFTTTPQIAYSDQEIIPSHQLMAKSQNLGDFFKLPWRLESDALNTLELVTPPFVFPKTELGNAARDRVRNNIEVALPAVSDQARDNHWTLPQTAGEIERIGLGMAWHTEAPYQGYGVIKKQKSGAAVLGQTNVSLFPEEIGQHLENKFAEYDNMPGVFAGSEPLNLARRIRYAFKLGSAGVAPGVTSAVAIFSRYASNILSIPSMMHRQRTGVRKDAMPTEVKETLGIWVKTDALNLLRDILSAPQDAIDFVRRLTDAKAQIRDFFIIEGEMFKKKNEADAALARIKFGETTWKDFCVSPIAPTDLPNIKLEKLKQGQKSRTEAEQRIETSHKENCEALQHHLDIMMQEIAAFIERALHVQEHVPSVPKSSTKEFLDEKYGTGEGVRKGTYLGAVSNAGRNMYVTEIR